MDTEEFRRHAHAFVDWMADHLRDVERYPVRTQVKPGEIAAALASAPPQDGEPMAPAHLADRRCPVGYAHRRRADAIPYRFWYRPDIFGLQAASGGLPTS